MKKVLSAVAIAAVVLAGGSCFAQGSSSGYPVYVKVEGKWVLPSDPTVEGLEISSDNGYGLGAAVGMHIDQFRIEGEIATQKTDINAIKAGYWYGLGIGSGDTRVDTLMLNGYYDIPLANGFGLYVTGGLGWGKTTLSIYNVDDSDTGFAWKVGAGASYAFNSNVTADLGWEYLGLDDPTIDTLNVSDINSNNIVLALRYKF